MSVLLAVASLLAATSGVGGAGDRVSAGDPVSGPSVQVPPADRAAPVSASRVFASTWNVGWRSSNWAGYALERGPYQSVSARWTVPHISATRIGFSAIWIGVDGVSDGNLIQTGTEQDIRNGRATYFAWWEILPAPAVRITSFTVRPGDHMSATISQASAGRWRIAISDARTGGFTSVRRYGGRGSSVEWIEEAPLVDGRLAPLARHGSITFDHAMANGANPGLLPGDGGTLVRRGQQMLTPSLPDGDMDGFRLLESTAPPSAPLS